MSNQQERRPRIVGWEITSYCNLRCPHCYSASSRRPRGELATEECERIIDSMAEIGVAMIGWTGGEPLLREDLEELIEHARSKGIKSNITTNGVLLDRHRATRLADAGIRAVQVSLDGPTPELNRRMRGTSDDEFFRIIEAIRLCKSLNLRVHMATLIGLETLKDAEDMIELGKRECVDTIRFCGFAPFGRGKRQDVRRRLEFTQDLHDLLQFIQRAQDNSSIVMTFDVSFGPVPPDYEFHKCTAGIETFYIKGNGDVYPCTSLLDRKFRVGNLREHSLGQIWNAPEMVAMSAFPREEIRGACRSCDNFNNCRGGCRGATLTQTGDLYESPPLCLYRSAVCIDQGALQL